MSSYNTGKECCTGACDNCKCRDINRFLESVLTLNHALSEAIYEELLAIKEIKKAVSSEFLFNLKKDLNNTLKLAMNKEVIVEMLLEEVKDQCEIIFYDTEYEEDEEQLHSHQACYADEHEDEKCLYSHNEPFRLNEFEVIDNEVLKEENDEVVKCVKEPLKENKKEKKLKEEEKQKKDSTKELKEDKKEPAKATNEDKKEKQEIEKKEKKQEKQEKTVIQEKEKRLTAEIIKEKVPEKPNYHDSYKYENDEDEETFIVIRSKGRR
ncbi:hypothetical protein M4D55_08215 [Metabacillus idriensis]|nr:hypothetical protein [Metabacillus idriensis]MCM3595763.1 hypothetical protein [Metabacillus idriensis]